MDIRHLQHVLLLAEELNFSRAADRAHLTQSAFSRSIQTAETQAGVKFFDRTQRSVKPTAVGKRIIERGRSILSEARDLDREIRFLESGHAGQLSIGAGTTIAASILPGVTTRFHRAHPQVGLEIEVSHWSLLLDDLLNEKLDFFIADISELTEVPGLAIQRLDAQRGSFYCRAGHPLLGATITRERLVACEYVAPQLPRKLRRRLAEFLGVEGGALDALIIECNSMDVLRALVRDTDVLLLNLAVAVDSEVSAGTLVDLWPHLPRALRQSPGFASEWGIVRLASRTQSPAAETFISSLVESAQPDGR